MLHQRTQRGCSRGTLSMSRTCTTIAHGFERYLGRHRLAKVYAAGHCKRLLESLQRMHRNAGTVALQLHTRGDHLERLRAFEPPSRTAAATIESRRATLFTRALSASSHCQMLAAAPLRL
jgi:hypothetical protein